MAYAMNIKKMKTGKKPSKNVKKVLNDNDNPDDEYGIPPRAYGGAWDLGVGKNPWAPRLPKPKAR